MISLRTYKTRHAYVQKCLIILYKIITSSSFEKTQTSSTELLELIVDLMVIHAKNQSVQLAATSCIHYLLLKKPVVPGIILTRLVNAILHTMRNLWSKIVMNNCMLILETDNSLLENCVS